MTLFFDHLLCKANYPQDQGAISGSDSPSPVPIVIRGPLPPGADLAPPGVVSGNLSLELEVNSHCPFR